MDEERNHLNHNLQKLSKKGTDIFSLLSTDQEKCKVELSNCQTKLEEIKIQIQKNDALKQSSENNLEDYRDATEILKTKLQGNF